MIQFTPRFFIVPLFALAVIASLPRPAAQGPMVQGCIAEAAPAASIIRLDVNPSAGCGSARQQFVMAPGEAVVR